MERKLRSVIDLWLTTDWFCPLLNPCCIPLHMLPHFPFNIAVQHSPLWLCTHNYSPLTSGSVKNIIMKLFFLGLYSLECLDIKEVKGIIHSKMIIHNLLSNCDVISISYFFLLCGTQKEILGKMLILRKKVRISDIIRSELRGEKSELWDIHLKWPFVILSCGFHKLLLSKAG